MARFKRILLKLSGESLMGEKQYGIDEKRLGEYAQQIKEIHEMGVQIGIVIGGGNIFRGLSGASKGFDRVKGDQMGMLATVINSLGLSSALGAAGVKTRVLTAVANIPIWSPFTRSKPFDAPLKPRKMLPPPITMPICTPISWISLICCAYSPRRFSSMPYCFSPMRLSPLSFRRILLNLAIVFLD